MIVFRLKFKHQTIGSVTTSSKLTSTLSSKILTFFVKKSKLLIVRTILFRSNFTSTWSKYFSHFFWETLDLQFQHNQWWHGISDRKIKFDSKFTVQTLSCYFSQCWSLNFLHIFLHTILYDMLVKFMFNRMDRLGIPEKQCFHWLRFPRQMNIE